MRLLAVTLHRAFIIKEKSICNLFEMKAKNDVFKESVECFKIPDNTHEIVFENGLKCVLALYNAPRNVLCSDKYRYICFSKAVLKKKSVNLASLPPTADAARQHLFRVYLQVQKWLSNDLVTEDWGWFKEDILLPVQMNKLPAPKHLLEMIFCKCKKGCTKMCSCRKAGLYCSVVCASCQAEQCNNLPPTFNEDDDDVDEHLDANDDVEENLDPNDDIDEHLDE